MSVFTELVPANQLAKNNGVKALLYGPPGSSKTPQLDLLKAWNPVVCVTEQGFLSMTHSSIACYRADTVERITEWVNWFVGSNEAKQFGFGCMDSLSESCEIALKRAEGRSTKGGNDNRGKQAYGEALRVTVDWLDKLYFAPGRNILCIAKEIQLDDGMNVPSFPGKAIASFAKHRFDWVGRLAQDIPPGQARQLCIRNKESFNAFARDRTGRLAELEPPDAAYCINKLLA